MSFILSNLQLINAKDPCLSPFDRGFTLGHGLFETLLVNQGQVPLIELHWQRLIKGLKLLKISQPFDFATFNRSIHQLIDANQLNQHRVVVRLTVTDGIAARGILSSGDKHPTTIFSANSLAATSAWQHTATIVTTRRNEMSQSAQIKSISYLDNILAKQEAAARQFDEAFLLNSKGRLAEGAVSNIFIVKDNHLYTPKIAEGALPGVIRHLLIHTLDCKVIETEIRLDALFNADEVFITNSLIGIRSIKGIDDHSYLKDSVIAKSLFKKLNRYTNNLWLEPF